MKILITGAAGFIGFHLSKKILKERSHVIGIDNLNNYYDVNLKKNRVIKLNKYKNFQFYKLDLNQKQKTYTLNLRQSKRTYFLFLPIHRELSGSMTARAVTSLVSPVSPCHE